MNKQDKIQFEAYNNIRDAANLKAVAKQASLTTGARTMGASIRKELRSRAAKNLWEARKFSPSFTRRVYRKHVQL